MRILPKGYTQLEYIQSSGTQYIDTGFKPNGNTRVVCDFQLPAAFTTSKALFGARDSTITYLYVFYHIASNAFRTDYYSNYADLTVPNELARMTVDKNKNVTTVAGVSNTYTAVTTQTPYNMYLFGVNQANTLTSPIAAKIYSCQIYNNGTLARNFVPCKNPSGEVGLYDLVNGVFYGNAGTGTFIAGPEFSYNEVEFIKSSGTQYIDTGFKHNQDTRVVIDAQVVTKPSAHAWLFEGRVSFSSCCKGLILLDGSTWNADYNNSTNRYTFSSIGVLDRLFIDYNKNNLTINGNTRTWTTTAFQSTANLTLLACNTAGTVSGNISAKIYSCQIYDNGVLVRDYIPVVGTDGVAGLWDKVERVFYGNAGTGAFVAGAIIPEEPDVPPVEIPETPTYLVAPYSDFANAVLMWNPVQGAETYNIRRDGVLVDTTEMPFYYDHDLATETVYSYAVTACNVAGESEPATIVAETTPFKLITDRTADDVQAVLTAISTGFLPNDWLAGMKGAYNATDFNRVEAAVLFVLKRLEVAGWYLSVQTKTDWTFVDFPNQAEMQRYLDNIRLLRAALPANIPAVPDTMRLLKYEDANRIEQILEMLDATVTNIMLNAYYANEIYSGEV